MGSQWRVDRTELLGLAAAADAVAAEFPSDWDGVREAVEQVAAGQLDSSAAGAALAALGRWPGELEQLREQVGGIGGLLRATVDEYDAAEASSTATMTSADGSGDG